MKCKCGNESYSGICSVCRAKQRLSCSAPLAGSVSDAMLVRAMKVAVEKGLIPVARNIEESDKNWQGMKACLEAAFDE